MQSTTFDEVLDAIEHLPVERRDVHPSSAFSRSMKRLGKKDRRGFRLL